MIVNCIAIAKSKHECTALGVTTIKDHETVKRNDVKYQEVNGDIETTAQLTCELEER